MRRARRQDARIAEEASALVRKYKVPSAASMATAVRGEWVAWQFGPN
jgi:hypothetical protein